MQANANSASPSNSQFNHKDVGFDARFGTGNQSKMSGVRGSASNFNVGVEVKNGNANAVTRQLTNNTELDAVRVTVTVPALQEQKDDGDIVGSYYFANSNSKQWRWFCNQSQRYYQR
ncbi:MAG: hypothetical protein CM15mV138_370 [Caudoviricetes sp.]|nr:MAG: hypothetical protein CM15mV138_370 [Caudoviricetes sp.]